MSMHKRNLPPSSLLAYNNISFVWEKDLTNERNMEKTYIYIYVPGQGTEGPPQWYPPTPPREEDFPSSFLLLSLLPSSFPSSFLLSLLPSKLCQQHITTTGGRRCFATLLQSSKPHLFIELLLLLIFSLNPFCFYIHSSKLYICSCNLYRALVIDNHHTTTPHHGGP